MKRITLSIIFIFSVISTFAQSSMVGPITKTKGTIIYRNVSEFFPRNKALVLSRDKRAELAKKMQQNDDLIAAVSIAYFVKTFPNLMYAKYDVRNDPDKATLTFLGDGTRIIFPISGDQSLKLLYKGYDGITEDMDIMDVLAMIPAEDYHAEITMENGTNIMLEQYYDDRARRRYRPLSIRVQDENGDCIVYTTDDYENFYAVAIRKTFNDGVVEFNMTKASAECQYRYNANEVRIIYSNGDDFTGALKGYTYGTNKIVEYILKQENCPPIGKGIAKCTDGKYKVYDTNGQLDELESQMYTSQRIEKDKQAKEAALAKVRQRTNLDNKYGKENVTTILEKKELKVGMPIELVKDVADANLIGTEPRLRKDMGKTKGYELFSWSRLKVVGYIWTTNGKITSIHYY